MSGLERVHGNALGELRLRRPVGTNLARLGVSKDIRVRLLNHVEGTRSVTNAVYNQHEFWAEQRAALERWEAELRRIVG